jgi:hemoglobin-like flavoprotein
MNVWSHPLASMHRGRAAPAPIDLDLIKRLTRSYDRILSAGDRMPELLFTHLLNQRAAVRDLFPPDIKQLKHQFARMLHWLVAHLHEPQKVRIALVDLGRRHQGYGVKSEYYPAIIDALLDTMKTICGDDWNDELSRDWRQTFELMVHHMLRAYRPDAL